MNKYFFIVMIFISKICLSYEINGIPHVIDGDTYDINNKRIRLLNVDCLEKKQLCYYKNIEHTCGNTYSDIVKLYLKNTYLNCECSKLDIYNRHLCTCYNNSGVNINKTLVERGWCLAYDNRYKLFENNARIEKKGIWEFNFKHPKQWRRENRKK